jgi:prepilin-type N-terminal cleavage/methylation domain-containing protein
VTDRRGLTLLEVLVAVAVLAVGVTAVQRLLVRSARSVAADADANRAMALARAVLAEAETHPPEPGHAEDVRPGGLRFARDVRPTVHPGLREIRVRVWSNAPGTACELLELVRVPPA